MINLLVAATENNVIGKNNKLLWHLPNDMRFFKNVTWGTVVIMGRKTYDSIGKPLPGRMNIIISRQKKEIAGVTVCNSVQEALDTAKANGYKEIFVIGGGEIFRDTWDVAKRIYMTRLHTEMDGDTFFPEINKSEWKLAEQIPMKKDAKHAFDYTFETWLKK